MPRGTVMGQTSQTLSNKLDIPLIDFSSASETPCPMCVFHSFKDVFLNMLCVIVIVLALNQREVNYKLVDGKNKSLNLLETLFGRAGSQLIITESYCL